MKFSIKNKVVRVALIVGAFIVFIVVVHFTVGRWILVQNLAEYKERSEKIHDKLHDKQELLRKHPNPEKKIKEIEKKMEELKKKSVSEKKVPKVIGELTKKSSELKIEIISIRPLQQAPFAEPKLPRGVSKAYIEVVLKVPYKVLGEYLKALDEMPMVVTLEGITLERIEELEEDVVDEAVLEKNAGKVIATLLVSSYTIK